jgi:hypothetical protein
MESLSKSSCTSEPEVQVSCGVASNHYRPSVTVPNASTVGVTQTASSASECDADFRLFEIPVEDVFSSSESFEVNAAVAL